MKTYLCQLCWWSVKGSIEGGDVHLLTDESIDECVHQIGNLGTLHRLLEGSIGNARVLSKPPVIGLLTGQSSAVNA